MLTSRGRRGPVRRGRRRRRRPIGRRRRRRVPVLRRIPTITALVVVVLRVSASAPPTGERSCGQGEGDEGEEGAWFEEHDFFLSWVGLGCEGVKCCGVA